MLTKKSVQDQGKARKNMLDCQLATSGIVSPEILAAFGAISRELFLPEKYRAMAYVDEDLPLESGGFCMEPLVHARMLQAAMPTKSQSVLNIGDMTGYSSAVLSNLVSTVVVLESAPGALDRVRNVWDDLGCCNIAMISGVGPEGAPDHAPYDLIFINGSIEEAPPTLLAQLSPGGRLVAVIRKKGERNGSVTVIEKAGEGVFSARKFFDAATPYAYGFEPVAAFSFVG